MPAKNDPMLGVSILETGRIAVVYDVADSVEFGRAYGAAIKRIDADNRHSITRTPRPVLDPRNQSEFITHDLDNNEAERLIKTIGEEMGARIMRE